ncbi:MAG: hypothetical protein JWQ89_1098 [Devosia sp.]|uniref:hypothetical protein n=1 Tax=Devosia sp. TaxID=1871048 RepID=UPI0026264ADA|nr:hypothetical protein [Devosia sp.]MDB5539371.1 hypothetical protein [Devosia sp.]
MADEIDEIGNTLRELARTARTPKQLLKETLMRHPKAKKKAIAHAAFLAMIDAAGTDARQADALQEVALNTRNADN